MVSSFDRRADSDGTVGSASANTPTPGKRTLTEQFVPVQQSPSSARPQLDRADGSSVQHAAAQGVAGTGGELPHAERIQRLFGRHDVSGIAAHVGGPAAAASRAIGAEAYATGHHVAFASEPSFHTAAHEAAHVVQQRAGVQLKGGIGEAGDAYEQHADQVADAVVAGRSAERLLDRYAAGAAGAPVVQCKSPAETAGTEPAPEQREQQERQRAGI